MVIINNLNIIKKIINSNENNKLINDNNYELILLQEDINIYEAAKILINKIQCPLYTAIDISETMLERICSALKNEV